MQLDHSLKKLISLLFPALFFLTPLFFTSVNSELFEFNKMILVYAFAALITGAWVSRMILQKKILFKKSFLDLPLILFLGSQILSTIFSIDLHTSLFGYYSRFNGGLLSTISYLTLYWAFVSNCEEKDVRHSIKWSLISAAIVSIYGIFEHFGHSFSCLMFGGTFDVSCWIQKVQERVFATLGQPNWLAAYLTVLTPLSWAFALNSKFKMQKSKSQFKIQNLKSIFYILNSIFFVCLLFTQSRSGFLGFVLSFVVFGVLSFRVSKANREIPFLFKPFLFLIFDFCLLIFIFGSPFQQINKYLSFNGLRSPSSSKPSKSLTPNPSPLTSLDGGISESGDIRKIVWRGAFNIFLHYPVLGSGVETFAYSYYNFRPMKHNLVSEWDFLYNKAHNEYLNFLSTTGILGLGTYLLLISSFIVWSFIQFKNQKSIHSTSSGLMLSKVEASKIKTKVKNLKPDCEKYLSFDIGFDIYILIFALLSGWLSLLITNFFGFSVVITSLYFFLIPAFITTLNFQLPTSNFFTRQSFGEGGPLPSSRFSPLVLIPIFCTLYILNCTFSLWRADVAYADGQKLAKTEKYYEAYQKLLDAKKLNPVEPVFLNELSGVTANLALVANSQKDATTTAQLSDLAILYSDNAKLISPRNINILKTRIKVFYTLSALKTEYLQKAIDTLLETIKLSPTDPKLVYNLGLLYGKDGKTSLAMKTIEKAVEMKPNYLDARNALAVFYEDAGERQKALDQLKQILKISPDNKDLQTRIEKLKSK